MLITRSNVCLHLIHNNTHKYAAVDLYTIILPPVAALYTVILPAVAVFSQET